MGTKLNKKNGTCKDFRFLFCVLLTNSYLCSENYGYREDKNQGYRRASWCQHRHGGPRFTQPF